MDNICDFFGIENFSAKVIAFLIDFTAVLSILAQFLDVIQGEKEVYSGIVLPMVKKLMTKLNEFLLSDSMTSRTTASLLLKGVNKRLRFLFLSYILNSYTQFFLKIYATIGQCRPFVCNCSASKFQNCVLSQTFFGQNRKSFGSVEGEIG
jgi:hypothetical protein